MKPSVSIYESHSQLWSRSNSNALDALMYWVECQNGKYAVASIIDWKRWSKDLETKQLANEKQDWILARANEKIAAFSFLQDTWLHRLKY